MDSRNRHRRGGFGNAGALPVAAAVAVGCEAELRAELEWVAAQLAPAVEWALRVEALLRLEGLVNGGAPGFAAFPELLAMLLRDALAAQMQERRSAVSRQACHAVGMLAAACGASFEPLAVHLLPVLFKTLAMGIQVVSEAADACAYAMLTHCPSQRLLPKLLSVLGGDKNGRLRQSAADYLLCALEGWGPSEYERQLEAVERAVLAAAADAQAETRATGRALFAAYARAWPAQAAAQLARLSERDRALHEKLAAAAAAAADFAPGMLPEGPLASQPVSRRSSLGNSGAATPRGLPRTSSLSAAASMANQQLGGGGGSGMARPAPVVPKLALSALGSAVGSTRNSPSHPSSARSAATSAGSLGRPAAAAWQPATARENRSDNRAAVAAIQATPRSMFSKTQARREVAAPGVDGEGEAVEPARQPPAVPTGRERLGLRRSLGGAALRMSVASFRRELGEGGEGGEESVAQQAAVAAASHRPTGPQRGSARSALPPLQLPAQGLEAPQQQQPEAVGAQGPRPLTARRLGALDRQASSIPEDSEVSSLSGSCEECSMAACGAAAASLAPLLGGLSKAGVTWADKVALFQSVEAALQQSGASQHLAADIASHADRLVAALLEGAGDAHFRVAAAALAALAAGLGSPCSRLFEPQLDRVMTALFARVVDPKEQIRHLVGAALAAVLQQQSADATVAALARSLQANRAPKVKCAVMDYFAAAASGTAGGSGSGRDAAGEEEVAASALLAQLTGSAALPGLLRSLVQLAKDKSPDIRRAAADALAAAYHGGEAQAVLAALHALPPADVLAVQRAIGPAIQQHSSDSGAGSIAGLLAAPPPLSRPSSRGAGASGMPSGSVSRRQSSEGIPQQQRAPQAESSGSLTARSRQCSQQGAPVQAAASAAAAAAPAVGQQPPLEATPEPPSPFAWSGGQPASPTPPGQPEDQCAASAPAVEQQQASVVLAAPRPQLSLLAALTAAAPADHHHQQQRVVAAHAAAVAPSEVHQLPHQHVSELAPFDAVMAGQLQRLLAQLEQGCSSEALQGLSRLAHVLPASAWPPCFDQILGALCAALDSGSAVPQDAALMLVRDLAAAAQPSLFLPALPMLLPRLLACSADLQAREVALAAEEALDQLLSRAPPQSCLGLLAPQLPAAGDQLGTDRQAGAQLHAVIRSLRRVVARMQPAGLAAHLQPLLLPGLCAAYRSPLADVRKATVDCLVAIWQVVGDALKAHLAPLSASQLKLLAIYLDKARGASTAAGSAACSAAAATLA